MNRRFSPLANGILVVLIVIGGVTAYYHHNQILDWWYLRNYVPPARVASLADQASLTSSGRRLFYRAQPQIDHDRTSLSGDCRIASDKTIELGCYLSTDRIYLMEIQEPDLKDEMIVTAAHETLHAAYDRLSVGEKRKINSQIEATVSKISDPRLKQRLDGYNQIEPGEQDNELHSILGSEYYNLSPDLEAYYGRYFSNRKQLLTYSDHFNKAFDGLHEEIINNDRSIKAMRAQMSQYLARGQVSAYNNMVPIINQQISLYNQKVTKYNRYSSELLGQESTQPAQ